MSPAPPPGECGNNMVELGEQVSFIILKFLFLFFEILYFFVQV